MRNHIIRIGVLCLIACASAPAQEPGWDCENPPEVTGFVEWSGDPDLKTGRYLAYLSESASEQVVVGVVGTTARRLSSRVMVYEPSPGIAKSSARYLAKQPGVLWVEEEGQLTIQQVPPWGLDSLDQDSLPLDEGPYSPYWTGQGVQVYVLDTGINPHEEFGDRLLPGQNFVDGEDDQDFHGHGSHVAGTIAGSTFGVAPGASVLSLKVCHRFGLCSVGDIVEALDYLSQRAAEGTPVVANMSIGGGVSPTEDAAVCSAIQAGAVVAVAAANDSRDACLNSPARVEQAVTAFAFDERFVIASFSNWGPCVDVGAPGVAVRSIGGLKSGTSMASPHVAGALAQCYERLVSCQFFGLPCGNPERSRVAQCVMESADAGDLSIFRPRTVNLRVRQIP